ncbi:MAG: hypothetical protein HXS41_13745 [Theionarchaea archaeon]|nr:hypothetical protein [Theionarchaea archaeon]MBU7000682.1 hypothetical protein [Theionarchaea archaeon]MBU7022114.1 hypothetical protein [Theionarchaea archaeon]MBU7036014.1 hypothetical protein [Theionarchaea archaeon]MBU7041900.1 hypothetical protein [Theionarchaea archaeon]
MGLNPKLLKASFGVTPEDEFDPGGGCGYCTVQYYACWPKYCNNVYLY